MRIPCVYSYILYELQLYVVTPVSSTLPSIFTSFPCSSPHSSLLSLPFPIPYPSPRQYQSQTMAVDMLRNEVAQLQQSYDQEKERYSRISMKMKVKERTKQDLGGITDTMVREWVV